LTLFGKHLCHSYEKLGGDALTKNPNYEQLSMAKAKEVFGDLKKVPAGNDAKYHQAIVSVK
jgi:hypothetical protein